MTSKAGLNAQLLSAVVAIAMPFGAGCGIDETSQPSDVEEITSGLAASCKTSCTAACNTQAIQEIDAKRAQNSFLGNPIEPHTVLPGCGYYRHYQNGSIYLHADTGAHVIFGEIRQRWAELGWERSALGYPTSDEVAAGTDGRRNTFQGGEIFWNPDPAGVSFFAQNMALLPPPASYNGTERSAAITGIINFLRSTRPTVAGLSEVFVDGERQTIKSAVADLYPFSLEGPDENDLDSDGGLLLLSRSPFLATSDHIYRSCFAEDCLSNKGILHARIDGPGAADFDVYLSHLQNPDVLFPSLPHYGVGSTATAKINSQLSALGDFVAATRRRDLPAIMLGDFNVKAVNGSAPADMVQRLHSPMDAWLVAGNGTAGITSGDPMSDFGKTTPVVPANDPGRFQSGNRIDYIFGHNGNVIRPTFSGTRVVVVKSPSGRDVSDHYGLMTTVATIRELRATYTRDPSEVTVVLRRLHCLKETSGPTGTGSDEVDFRMTVDPASGTTTTTARTALEDNVDAGVRRLIASQSRVVKSSPGASVTVGVEGWEVDPSPFGETGRASLGTANLVVQREEIFEGVIAPVERFVRLRSSAGGEYIIGVTVSSR